MLLRKNRTYDFPIISSDSLSLSLRRLGVEAKRLKTKVTVPPCGMD